jgi:hypothetical protein
MRMKKKKLRLSDIDAATLEHYRADPSIFIEEVLVSPYNSKPYRLIEVERTFITHAFQRDTDGRLLYPLLIYSAIKKGRKTELAGLITIAMIILFGGKYATAFICANNKDQAVDLCFTGCQRVLEASPLFKKEACFKEDQILFPATQSTIRAIANTASGLAGVHPTISVHDELWQAPSGERGRAVWDQLVPTPSRKTSCRLITSHAGVADPDHLLFQLHERGMQLPEIGKDLRGGDGMLMFWSHEPLHEWQNEKWLHEMRRELLPGKYSYMIENRFVTATSAYITPEMFDRCVRDLPPPSGRLVIYVAVDAGWKRDNAAVVAVTIEGDQIRYVYEKVFKPTPDDPLNFENTIEKSLLYLHEHCTIKLCLVDPTQMEYMRERLQKLRIPIETLTQNPENQTDMAQTLYDLFRTERFSISSQFNNSSALRETITRTVFEERANGLRLAKHQSIKTDLTTALAMACLAATQRSDKPGYTLEPFDENFRDKDLPPESEPELEPLRPGPDWWKGVRRGPSMSNADDQLNNYYQQIAMGIQWGLIR